MRFRISYPSYRQTNRSPHLLQRQVHIRPCNLNRSILPFISGSSLSGAAARFGLGIAGSLQRQPYSSKTSRIHHGASFPALSRGNSSKIPSLSTSSAFTSSPGSLVGIFPQIGNCLGKKGLATVSDSSMLSGATHIFRYLNSLRRFRGRQSQQSGSLSGASCRTHKPLLPHYPNR